MSLIPLMRIIGSMICLVSAEHSPCAFISHHASANRRAFLCHTSAGMREACKAWCRTKACAACRLWCWMTIPLPTGAASGLCTA